MKPYLPYDVKLNRFDVDINGSHYRVIRINPAKYVTHIWCNESDNIFGWFVVNNLDVDTANSIAQLISSMAHSDGFHEND